MLTLPAKSILASRPSPEWFGTDYNMNLYRGCCHGCIYCDSRSDCYGNTEFDTVKAKADAIATLRGELRRRKQPGVVATGSMSDPYNPHEARELLTRQALLLLAEHGFGVAIATKSDLVTRDIDVLQRIAARAPVIVKVTITAADDALCAKIEPRVAPTSRRLEALRTLSNAGIFCGVLMMPVLPFVTDAPENLRAIVAQVAQAGARFLYPGLGVTTRDGQRAHYYAALDRLFPGVKERHARAYGTAYHCPARDADALWAMVSAACAEHGLLCRMEEIVAAYKAPYAREQLTMFL